MKNTFTPLLLASLLALGACSNMGSTDLGGAISAASKGAKAMSLTDEEVASYARQAAAHSDKEAKIAPAGSAYTQRLNKLVAGLQNEDGMQLNFKVYQSPSVNAFAMADGTVRIYSGLMDKMTDDEIRFVIGHEIGHVKLGHSKKALQTAYATRAVREAAVATGNAAVAVLSASTLGGLAEDLVNAQFSQSQESDSDAYALAFMQRRKYSTPAAVTALRKLAGDSGGQHSMLSSHPAPGARADKIAAQLK